MATTRVANAQPAGALLTAAQMERYSRQIILEEMGIEGQARLLRSKVLIVGAGGLGSPTALYLAAAGVGTIGIVDGDQVDVTNLHRQILHGTPDLGRPKTESAQRTLGVLNPDVTVVPHQTVLTSANALEIIGAYDVVINGSDNFPTRYLVNDACVLLGKPNVYGSIFRFDGQASVFFPPHGPCYRCLYPEPPPPDLVPNCAEGGVLGILPGMIGVVQATETVKLLLGKGRPLIGRLLLYDALAATFTEVKIHRDPDCPICSRDPSEISDDELGVFPDYEAFCAAAG